MNLSQLSVFKAALIGLVTSVIGNVALLFIFLPMVTAFAPLSVGPVIFWSVIGFLGAWAVYALLRKFVAHANHDFTAVAILGLIVSYIPDIYVDKLGAMFAGSTPGAIALLMAMHTLEAAIAVYVFTKLAKAPEMV